MLVLSHCFIGKVRLMQPTTMLFWCAVVIAAAAAIILPVYFIMNPGVPSAMIVIENTVIDGKTATITVMADNETLEKLKGLDNGRRLRIVWK